MKFGIAVTTSVTPAVTESSQRDYVEKVSIAAERTQYDSVWVSDRTVFPSDLVAKYPDRFGDGKSDPRAQNVLEALTTLSYVAGLTKKVRLGTSVLVLPFRNPVLNSKMVATLDVLSGGRLILGVGTGWMPEEFSAMNADFQSRGNVSDEHLEYFLESCKSEIPIYKGTHLHIEGMKVYPQAQQKPSPPIWIGGNSLAAMRRTVKYASGWHGIRLTPKELGNSLRKLKNICDEKGRDIRDIEISLRCTVSIGEPLRDASSDRLPLTGEIEAIQSDLVAYQEAGLDYLVISMAGDSTEQVVESVSKFASDVAGHFL